MKTIARAHLSELLQALADQASLYLPQIDAAGQTAFLPYAEGCTLNASCSTAVSPKGLFFPQVENLIGFKREGKTISLEDIRENVENFIVFGIRGCDVQAIRVLDNVFLAEPVDTFYQSRREHSLLISLACGEPRATCFCHTFGIDAASPEGDVTCWLDNTALYWQANTEKGQALTARLPMLEDCPETSNAQQKAAIREKLQALPLHNLSTEGFGPGKTQELFNRPEWATLSQSCLGCGSCTFVCPTCQCYDVEEFNDGHTVRRFRCWDSCMYSDFTQMSAGQPRATQLERFRQRFMHKLVYYPENNDGLFGCVGCGRCLQKCPIHMHIVKVIQTLGGDRHDA